MLEDCMLTRWSTLYIYIGDRYGEAVYTVIEATPPNITTGVVMGNNDQIMFYLSDKSQVAVGGESPYFPSEEACIQSTELKTSYFKFTRNSSLIGSAIPLTLPQASVGQPQSVEGSGEYCFIKVAIYDCSIHRRQDT